MADYTTEPIKYEPIDPTHCPACLSGTPPPDPIYDKAIAVE
jgi:hypothetical protein